MKQPLLSIALISSCLTSVAAFAADSYVGQSAASELSAVSNRLPNNIVPSRYYAPAVVPSVPQPIASQQAAEIATAPTSAAVPTYTAVPVAAPARLSPSEQPEVGQPEIVYSQPTPQPQPEIIYSQPASQPQAVAYSAPPPPPVSQRESVSRPAVEPIHSKKYEFSLGMEGFGSHYNEDDTSRDTIGSFASVTASYTRHFNPRWYGMLDLRGSYGVVDDDSEDGKIEKIKEWETENRILAGYVSTLSSGSRLKTYLGLGGRYFSNEGKGLISDTGNSGFDTRSFQLYVPLGVTYEFNHDGITFAPNLEIDPVLWGNVESRLGTFDGLKDLENRQYRGIGIRSEFLVGQMSERGFGWQFGPFVRFWYFGDSSTVVDPADTPWILPENTLLQAGAKLKYLF